ncbi:hypothetical protein AVEN_84653-1 [Araneus ventricosus]|uniref:Uncharacterized protein n=1 Tax=Araneus ventricosus TaxID=182803 RepID=A0A4Y2HKI2_ARAVE|nr:hypothetical protein AVEN_84653-1 [Araneus ventricosus]
MLARLAVEASFDFVYYGSGPTSTAAVKPEALMLGTSTIICGRPFLEYLPSAEHSFCNGYPYLMGISVEWQRAKCVLSAIHSPPGIQSRSVITSPGNLGLSGGPRRAGPPPAAFIFASKSLGIKLHQLWQVHSTTKTTQNRLCIGQARFTHNSGVSTRGGAEGPVA